MIATKKILAKHPVYKIKTDKLKHKLAKLFLKSVAVESETLLLEFGLK